MLKERHQIQWSKYYVITFIKSTKTGDWTIFLGFRIGVDEEGRISAWDGYKDGFWDTGVDVRNI